MITDEEVVCGGEHICMRGTWLARSQAGHLHKRDNLPDSGGTGTPQPMLQLHLPFPQPSHR
jgi:hypothetical protein